MNWLNPGRAYRPLSSGPAGWPPPDYVMDVASLTVSGDIPPEMMTSQGAFGVLNDGSANYVGVVTTNAIARATVPGAAIANVDFTFEIGYENTSPPAASYFFPGFDVVFANAASALNSYDVVMTRGVGETRGALWFQKTIAGSGSTLLGLGIGVSGTTFAANEKYICEVTCTGSPNRTMTAYVQRLSDSKWLDTTATWQSGAKQMALQRTDSSSPLAPGAAVITVYQSAVDCRLYAYQSATKLAQQESSNPVLTKGGTYNTWVADAIAAPGVCYDGSRYVLTVSLWDATRGKWASAFFTSSNLKAPWTYVANSLFVPTGSDYIAGNGAVEWWNGAYWFIYDHYPQDLSTPPTATILTGTDLIAANWTVAVSDLASGYAADPHIVANPNNGKLEAYYLNASRNMAMYDSPSPGTTWTSRGVFYTLNSDYNPHVFGATQPYYFGGVRYMTMDSAPIAAVPRQILGAHSPGSDTNWVFDGPISVSRPAVSWESVQVFDAAVIVADTGDGRGSIRRMLYAGGDTAAGTDNTDSSLGLAYLTN